MAGTTQIRKTRCSFGHFYDAVRYPQCPHCRTMQYTPVMSDEEKREVARLASIYVHGEKQETIHPVVPERSISQRRKENYYVTGWLVCIEGPETGRCYPLYHGEKDLVGVGKSLMEFVAFCVGEHKWNRQR